MPVLWEFLGDALVLKYVGNPSTQERRDAVAEAVGDPAFRAGLGVVFDLRSSISTVGIDELKKRAEWAVGLTALGFRPRYALVGDAAPFGMAQAGVRQMEGRIELAIVATLEEALAWVAAPGSTCAQPESRDAPVSPDLTGRRPG